MLFYKRAPVGAAYCALWGKCRRWVMVTNEWLRVFVGVIRLSASRASIFFSKSINSRLSAFSAKTSVPSRFVMLTCSREETGTYTRVSRSAWLESEIFFAFNEETVVN